MPAKRTTKPVFRVYIAASLDGYIADASGGVKWLDKYNDPSLGFKKFEKSIDTIIVGRKTYEQTIDWGFWEQAPQRVIVMTRKHLANAHPGVESFTGDVRQLAKQLAREGAKQVWLMGGGESIRPFHEAGLIDRWELFVIPVMLGAGVPLFPKRDGTLQSLDLVSSRAHKRGIVELQYQPAKRSSAKRPTVKAKARSRRTA